MVKAIKSKAGEAPGQDEFACKLRMEELDEINWKLNIAISTLDLVSAEDVLNGNAEKSIRTLASEALSRLEEARDILNPEPEEK